MAVAARKPTVCLVSAAVVLVACGSSPRLRQRSPLEEKDASKQSNIGPGDFLASADNCGLISRVQPRVISSREEGADPRGAVG